MELPGAALVAFAFSLSPNLLLYIICNCGIMMVWNVILNNGNAILNNGNAIMTDVNTIMNVWHVLTTRGLVA